MTEEQRTTVPVIRADELNAEPADFFKALGEALAPRFEQQRRAWERKGPAAMAAFEATGAVLDTIGGNCPVQAEGDVDGQRFYFRARGASWEFHVAPTDDQIFSDQSFCMYREYGSTFEAGWMHQHEALGFIVEAITIYRALEPAKLIIPALTVAQRRRVGADLDEGLPAGVAVAFITKGLIEKQGETSVCWSPLGWAVAHLLSRGDQ